MKEKTILIFGISSFVGSNLAQELKDEYRIVGTYYETPVNIEGVLALKCDINNKDSVQNIVLFTQPDYAVYCVGLTDINACQDFPKVADALNTVGVYNASNASERYGAKFIYFSSSYIFSGEEVVFKENDTPVPSSVYGNTVASSEFYIQKSCLNYIIFRCCPLYGRSYNPYDLKWMEVLEKNIADNTNMPCDTKVYTGFLDIWTMVKIFKICIENDVTNKLLQVSTCDMKNRYDFAKEFIDVFGGNEQGLMKADWRFPRTENQVALQNLGEEMFFEMDTYNIEGEVGFEMPTIRESLEVAKAKLQGKVRSKKSKRSSEITYI